MDSSCRLRNMWAIKSHVGSESAVAIAECSARTFCCVQHGRFVFVYHIEWELIMFYCG